MTNMKTLLPSIVKERPSAYKPNNELNGNISLVTKETQKMTTCEKND